MNIATVQKRKFLNNIYKLYYSSGNRPSDHSVKKAFTDYFSVNKFGDPVQIDTSRIQISSVIDHNVLNELMINSLLNLEVLYECVMENNQQIFGIVNTLNNKLENLRAKRKELESKIDQLLFSINNTNGFFYSYLENFSTLEKIDMDMTSVHVDTTNNHAIIPKIVSTTTGQNIAQSIINPASVKYSVIVNNTIVVNDSSVSGFDSVLDGLNDTYWNYSYNSSNPSIVALTLTIPITVSTSISKFEGALLSSTPCSIFVRAIPVSTNTPEVIKSQSSKGDYNRFSFSLPAVSYSSIVLTIYKNEPDRVSNNESAPYVYEFGIRELSTLAEYYDERAQLISKPISVPTYDNALLSISAVSLEANHQINPGVAINYYVAADVPNSQSVSDFDWIPIEPTNFNSDEEPKIVNLVGSTTAQDTIGVQSEGIGQVFTYSLIPISTTANNANDLNPVSLPFYPEKTVYRVAQVNQGTDYLQPYMLASTNSFKYYTLLNLDNSKNTTYMYKSLQQWADIINSITNLDLSSGTFQNTNSVITIPRNEPHSGLIETKIFCQEEKVVSHELNKSLADGNDMNVSLYLNGLLIADLPAGQTIGKIEWNFVKGINNLAVVYDKPFTGRPTIDLMISRNLTDYGIVFLDYFSYLDPIDFGRKTNDNESIFTIMPFYGSKQILASKQISNPTILRYYLNRSDIVNAVRFRADLVRHDNPLQSPIIDAVRIKFKHNDS